MFSDGENTYRSDDGEENRGGGSGVGGTILLILLFFPSWLTGFFVAQLLRVIRLRPSMITLICAAAIGIIASTWSILDFNERFSRYFSSFESAATITSNWTELIAPVVSVYVVLGIIGGWVYCLWQAREIRKKPELLSFTGYWTHNFKYRKTPLQILRKKSKVKGLKEGKYRGDYEAPLGLHEGDDTVVSRLNDEAVLHTVITGGTGSGKAIHKDTLVPVKDKGFMKAGDLMIGDVLYDENAEEAELMEVFQPKVEGHYSLTFSDSAQVKTCAEHLWAVTDFRGGWAVFSSAQLYEKMNDGSAGDGHKFAVKALTQPIAHTDLGTVEERLEIIAQLCAENETTIRSGEVVLSADEKTLSTVSEAASSLGWVAYREERSVSFYPEENIFASAGGASAAASATALERSVGMNRARNTQREIVSVEPIEDNAEDYFCFTVDSPNSLFLITQSYIPTHNTISMLSLIKADITAGRPVFVLDMKRSPDLASKLAKWVAENEEDHDSKFYHFVNGDPESYDIPGSPGQAFYDPLKSGSPTSKADMILGMREYDQASAVYKAAMQRLLNVLFSMTETIRRMRESTGDTDLCSSIDWDNGGVYLLNSAAKTDNFIELLTTVMNKADDQRLAGMAKDLLAETSKRSSMLSHALGELQGQMQTILSSEYGDWLRTEKGSHSIDLFEASRTPGSVVLFSLNSDDEKEFARFVGSVIMADITRVSAMRRNKDISNLINVYIDEFQILVPDSVTDLLEKSRASAMGITLAQQSLSQVIKGVVGDGEAYLQSILDTCSNFIFHYGSGFETAERMSKIVGKHEVEKYSINKRDDRFIFSFNWRNRRQLLVNTSKEDKWVVEPSEFMNLSSPSESNGYRSTAIIIKKSSSDPNFRSKKGATARETWMVPDQEILEKTYIPTNAVTRRIYDERHEELDDYKLLPSSAFTGDMGVDVSADVEKHLKRKKIDALRGIRSPETQGVNAVEEDGSEQWVSDAPQIPEEEPYFPGLEPDVGDYAEPASEQPQRRTGGLPAQPSGNPSPQRSGAPEGFSQLSEEAAEEEDDGDWSLEDLLDDEEEDSAPTQKPAPAKERPSGGLPVPTLSSPPESNTRGGSQALRRRAAQGNQQGQQQGRRKPSGGLPKLPHHG